MVFTTQIFLFVFFPLCMLMYILTCRLERLKHIGKWISRFRGRDLVIIVFSLGFYTWACFDDLARLLVYVGTVYLLALWIERSKRKRRYVIIENRISGVGGVKRRLQLTLA